MREWRRNVLRSAFEFANGLEFARKLVFGNVSARKRSLICNLACVFSWEIQTRKVYRTAFLATRFSPWCALVYDEHSITVISTERVQGDSHEFAVCSPVRTHRWSWRRCL